MENQGKFNPDQSCSFKVVYEKFRNSKMMNFLKGPILENPNLKKVPKVLVLQHCRGEEQIDLDSGSDSECETDGAIKEYSHRMVSKLACENTIIDNLSQLT